MRRRCSVVRWINFWIEEANMPEQTAAQTGRVPQVTGLFRNREDAEHVYSSLLERGYSRNDINVIMSETTRDQLYRGDTFVESEYGDKALEGVGVGGALGGVAGALIGAIAAIGASLTLPGLGLWIAGPMVGALAGAGAGGFTGGIVGGLIGAG